MKDTPIQKAIADIEAEMKKWESQDPSPVRGALLWSKLNLQSLLPYERECIEGAYVEGWRNIDSDKSSRIYFTQTFKTNPQGGGVE